jgi:threonylcarbamoyladenosine tRNA methylthiotransferase MtaB
MKTPDTPAPPLTVSFATLGCRVNQAESETLARQFARQGFEIVPFDAPATVAVLNTCTVTNEADREARKLIRRVTRANPDGLLVVTGCYASVSTAEVAAHQGVDVVVTNAGKDGLVPQVTALLRERGHAAVSPPAGKNDVPGWFGRTRAQLKVEEGCDNRCTFCIVPTARGGQRSVAVDRVVDTIHDLERAGYREVVLTGTHLGGYGRDLTPRQGLRHLIAATVQQTTIDRIRLSSVEPQDFPIDSLALWENPRLCRHFHLPVQSGDDAMLHAMRRGYRADRFIALSEAIYTQTPDAAITTDVIVGFPGETDTAFQHTIDLLERCRVARVHVFPYSPRTGTPAATMPDQVPSVVKRQRVTHLNALSAHWHAAFRARFVGRRMRVLFEQESEPGLWEGLTDNYVRVRCRHQASLFNVLQDVHVDSLDADGACGTLAPIARGRGRPLSVLTPKEFGG